MRRRVWKGDRLCSGLIEGFDSERQIQIVMCDMLAIIMGRECTKDYVDKLLKAADSQMRS